MLKKYTVQWKYRSSLGGPWDKGQEVELNDADAEAINRDSPGVLKLKAPSTGSGQGKEKDLGPEIEEVTTRQLEESPQNRQVKAAAKKR